MALLQAAVNIDPNPHKVDDYTPLAYGNALVAEIGPQGTVSEVKDNVTTEISLYTVRAGDTLSQIAEMFGVSVNTIIWANELGNKPVIKEGQKLVILPITGIRYTVKKGDTIKGIVNKYKSNLEEVLGYNDLSLDSTLAVGSVIVIPDAEFTDTPIISSPKTAKSTTPFYPGYYMRPISGGVKTQGIHGHNAVDLAAPIGTVIHAAAAGKVISSISNGGWNGGYGNYVIISHDNGTQTLYAHTEKNFVSVGDTVEQGQMIAKIGLTGKTTGPHVHFEIRGAKNPF
jgi:murein DD-endopeptidase MepM/ murein hydrolase activator NlpD